MNEWIRGRKKEQGIKESVAREGEEKKGKGRREKSIIEIESGAERTLLHQ